MREDGIREVVGGLALFVGCVAYSYGAIQYKLGSAIRMGPGFYPTLLGLAGSLVAAATVIRGVSIMRSAGVTETTDAPVVAFRPMAAVTASIVIFALLIQTGGLVVATAGSVIVAAMADRTSTVRGTLMLTGVLSAACWFIFSFLLGLSVPAFVGL
jgi:hypothetical protein